MSGAMSRSHFETEDQDFNGPEYRSNTFDRMPREIQGTWPRYQPMTGISPAASPLQSPTNVKTPAAVHSSTPHPTAHRLTSVPGTLG